MMISPVLTFAFGNEGNNDLSLSVENQGFGPAVVQEVIIQIDRECFDSANYVSYPDWSATYKDRMVPAFARLFTDGNSDDSRKPTFVPDEPTVNVRSPGQRQDQFETIEIWGTTTTTTNSLSPGQIIEAGGKLLVFKSAITAEIERTAKDNTSNSKISPFEKWKSLHQNDYDKLMQSAFEKVSIAIDYCSFSNQTCALVTSGESKCFKRLHLQ
jgi:hypothetical protein